MEGEGRYHRQQLVDRWDQEKVRRARVFIAGVGALGSVAALNLAMMGVGELVLVDYDTVEVSNLNRQLLYREGDVGRNKAEAAREFLLEVNPEVTVKVFPNNITEVPRGEYERCNVIIDGLDTFEARRWLNSLAVDLRKPLVHGGIYGWWGNVQVVVPYVTPCLECQPLVSKERLAQPCTPAGESRKTERGGPEEGATPAVVTVSCVIGGLQAQETAKIILGLEPFNGYLFYDGLSGVFTAIELRRNPKCVVCGEEYAVEGVEYALDPNETFGEFKERVKLTFGLGDPVRIVHAARLVGDGEVIGNVVKDGGLLFVYDQTRAKPVKIKVRFS
ncbi:MAG: ThiF family adenylyltransferase [Candidatus Freyarchaeota archaeon]|nr:ThiF family adenylyltransferase [Candidatus Jordarchaeia archaeon]